jgi:fructosamine-3-kinase
MLSNKDIDIIEEKTKTKVLCQESLHGGNINSIYLLKTTTLPMVVKSNSLKEYPKMFEYEKKGLEKLEQTKTIRIVETINQVNSGDLSFLVLNYVQPRTKTKQFWENFGIKLNLLHQTQSNSFGLDSPNYIGNLPQFNNWCSTWSEFYVTQRLEPQLKKAIEKGFLKGLSQPFEKLFHNIDTLFPKESPSLIHGDLWRENFISGENNTPFLIDPSIYFGHREMDIGMSLLFGGFESPFYAAYNNENPLEKKWEERVPLTQLYPLLVHLNLFGNQYEPSIAETLNRFV